MSVYSPAMDHNNFQGYHGDTSATYFCGDVDDEAKKLVEVAFSSFFSKLN